MFALETLIKQGPQPMSATAPHPAAEATGGISCQHHIPHPGIRQRLMLVRPDRYHPVAPALSDYEPCRSDHCASFRVVVIVNDRRRSVSDKPEAGSKLEL